MMMCLQEDFKYTFETDEYAKQQWTLINEVLEICYESQTSDLVAIGKNIAQAHEIFSEEGEQMFANID